MRISVYAASSAQVRPEFAAPARDLGRILAGAGHTVVYGGGGVGLMGAVADGAIEAGGEVIGIIPRFMTEVEWQHPGIARLDVVEDMRERKHRLLTGSDAVVALPGFGVLVRIPPVTWSIARPGSVSPPICPTVW